MPVHVLSVGELPCSSICYCRFALTHIEQGVHSYCGGFGLKSFGDMCDREKGNGNVFADEVFR